MYFLAEAVSTACYTQNRTLINKDLMKTPYEIMNNRNLLSNTFMYLVPDASCSNLAMIIVVSSRQRHMRVFLLVMEEDHTGCISLINTE